MEGAEWQRQRKITSSPFNEESMSAVWNESIRQAQEVLQYWTSEINPIFDTAKHVRILSLHVLSSVGFGKSYSFNEAAEPPKPGHMFNYRDSLSTILDHIMLILVFGPKFLTCRFLPKKWSRIGQAISDFKAYMKDVYTQEKQSMSSGSSGATNIMTSLIRASGEADVPEKGQGSSMTKSNSKGLSESEIYGNTFVYNFAGHDTTAITFSWTMYLLAAHPRVQDWIAEELNEYLGDSDPSTFHYNVIFPKLKRCHAVLVSPYTLDLILRF